MITLRLGERHSLVEEAKALADAITRNPGSCDTVWFSTLYGYPPIDVHEKQACKIAEASKVFRDAGIGVSLQIVNTIGHGPRIKSSDCRGLVFENSPAERMIGPKGKGTPYCFCWRGKYFRDYINKVISTYTELIRPDSIWVDDDLRADCHGVGDIEFGGPYDFGCYCDTCISEFNKKYETSFSRNEIVDEVTYGNPMWRKRYIDFCREGIGDFASSIAKTVKAISPDTVMAHQFAHWGNYMADNNDHILDAFYKATGNPPQVRPGGGYYHDKEPLGQFVKALGISLANSVLPDYVKDKKAEVENLPNVAYGKSLVGTIKESTLYLAYGCTGLTYTIVQSNNEPLSRQEKFLSYFSKIRPYWEKLSQISKATTRGGIAIVHGKAPYLRILNENEEPFSWANIPFSHNTNLMTVGIPITHEQKMPCAYLLHNEMIDCLTVDDIEFLLSKPVLTDAQSIKLLCDRGFESRFRLKLTSLKGSSYEVITNHEVNKDASHNIFAESYHFLAPMNKYIIESTDNSTEFLGMAHNTISKNELGGATVIASTYDKDGHNTSKWLVSGYCVWSDIISESKRNQLLNGIDYISPMPAKLLSAEQCAVIPSIDNDNITRAVSVASASIGGTENIKLLVRKPFGKKITIMSTELREIKPLSIQKKSDCIIIELPKLIPYEIITVFFEE